MTTVHVNFSPKDNRPKELLVNIIQRAKAGGFVYGNILDENVSFDISSFNRSTGRLAIVVRNREKINVVYDSIYTLFFDTSFAKAIFGDEWVEHLVELAQTDDKLEYLINANINKNQALG